MQDSDLPLPPLPDELLKLWHAPTGHTPRSPMRLAQLVQAYAREAVYVAVERVTSAYLAQSKLEAQAKAKLPDQVQAALDEHGYSPTQVEPMLIELVRELREAVGLFSGAMPISPKQAWDEAIAKVRAHPLTSEWNDAIEAAAIACESRRVDTGGTWINDHNHAISVALEAIRGLKR